MCSAAMIALVGLRALALQACPSNWLCINDHNKFTALLFRTHLIVIPHPILTKTPWSLVRLAHRKHCIRQA